MSSTATTPSAAAAASDIEAAASLWPLGGCLAVRHLAAGRSNDSFHLSTPAGEFVLRRCRAGKTAQALAFEHALGAHLAGRGLPVPAVVRSRRGAGHETWHGRLWTVTTFAPGGHMPRNAWSARTAAAILARFHRATTHFPPALAAPPEEDRLGEVARVLDEIRSAPGLEAAWSPLPARTRRAAMAAGALRASRVEALPRTLIHGSCRQSSILVHEEAVTAALDLDGARTGTRAEDIGIALASFAKQRDGLAAADEPLLLAFRDGYVSVGGLERTEIAALPGYLAQALLYSWAKTLERAVRSPPPVPGPDALAKARWRLDMAERIVDDPEWIVRRFQPS